MSKSVFLNIRLRHRTLCAMLGALVVTSCADPSLSDANNDKPHLDPALSQAPPYPTAMLASGESGKANIDCDISVDGRAVRCAPRGGTNAVFVSAAMDYLMHAQFLPALHNGRPVPGRQTFHMLYRQDARNHGAYLISNDLPVPPAAILAGLPSSPRTLFAAFHCAIDTGGIPHDCTIDTEQPAFRPAALYYAMQTRFAPAVHNATPIAGEYLGLLEVDQDINKNRPPQAHAAWTRKVELDGFD